MLSESRQRSLKSKAMKPSSLINKTIQQKPLTQLPKRPSHQSSKTQLITQKSTVTQKPLKQNIKPQKSTLHCGIQHQYLNPINYLSTCEFAKKRNILYKNYCAIIQAYYLQFSGLAEKYAGKMVQQNDKSERTMFLREFKMFLYEFMYIFKDVSIVQISYFEKIQQDFMRRSETLEFNTNQLVQKLQTYKKSQLQFKQTFKTHHLILQQIIAQHQTLKKDSRDPYSYFNRKLTTKKANQLMQNLTKQQKTRQTLRKDLDQVHQNSQQFQSNLIMYRQLLFTNKYKIIKKLTQISKSSRNSLLQFLIYLTQCTYKKNEQFAKYQKTVNDSYVRKRSRSFSNNQDKLAVESYLVEVTNDYYRVIEDVEGTLRNVCDVFEELRRFNSGQLENKKKILELLNVVYDIDQNPDNQVSKTLNFYQDFCTKLSEISNGINIATNELIKLKKQAKKLAQITLSLIRNTKSSHIDLQQTQTNHHSQIDILLQKLSFDYPITLIHNVYKDFQKNLTYLKNDVSQKFHLKKRHLMDSMDVSQFQDETLIKPKKRICQKELWLWEKWQNQIEYKIEEAKIASLQQVRDFVNSLMTEIPQGKEIDRFSCSLDTKGETSGFLIITDKFLRFESSQGVSLLTVLIEQIEQAKIAVKMFGKMVSVETTNGVISFRGCIDPPKVLQAIQEARNSSGAPLVKAPRKVMEITAEQLAAMQERKNKFKQILPKCEQFTFQAEVILENISIDHVYQLIYSDKEVTIRGKTQPNFFAYMAKRGGASNYQATKYDSVGPKFYTHEEAVSFLNCPNFSTRIINYDVKLPPIPFMPKYAHNREECKLYWVSNEELYYLIHNNATGAPGTDAFFIEVLNKLSKHDEKHTKISFWWRIVFEKETFLKSTITASATEESKKNIQANMVDIKKYCHQVSCSESGAEKGSDQALQNDQNEVSREKQQDTQGLVGNIIDAIMSMIKKIIGLVKGTKPTIAGQSQTSRQQKETTAEGNKGVNMLVVVLIVVLVLNLLAYLLKSGN